MGKVMRFELLRGDPLHADLTMQPKDLPKFYDARQKVIASFANGSRLVYPMDKKAMRFLNLYANKMPSVMFSWLLGQSFKRHSLRYKGAVLVRSSQNRR